MEDRFCKIAITDDNGNIQKEVNSLMITNIEWWNNNKESVYDLIKSFNLEPAIVHKGLILEFPDDITMATAILALEN
jgi:hypothetical protein